MMVEEQNGARGPVSFSLPHRRESSTAVNEYRASCGFSRNKALNQVIIASYHVSKVVAFATAWNGLPGSLARRRPEGWEMQCAADR